MSEWNVPDTSVSGEVPYRVGPPEAPIQWSPTEVLGLAWDWLKADPGVVVGLPLIGWISSFAFSTACNIVSQIVAALLGAGADLHGASPGAQLAGGLAAVSVMFVATVLNVAFQACVSAGVTHVMLGVARGQKPGFGSLLAGPRWCLRLLGSYVVLGCAVSALLVPVGAIFAVAVAASERVGSTEVFAAAGGATILLTLVPMVVLALGCTVVTPLIVDRGYGPLSALRESWRITRGHRGAIMAFSLLCCALSMLGFLTCGLGFVVLSPLTELALAIIYLRLTRQPTPSPSPFDVYGQPPPRAY